MLTPLRLLAIAVILVAATFGWFVLGGSVAYRTDMSGGDGAQRVGSLWGQPQVQSAPTFTTGTKQLDITSSDIEARFELDQRKKGLLWYATYAVDLDATYQIANDSAKPRTVQMHWPFPTADGVYDGFAVIANGKELPVTYVEGGALVDFEVAAGKTALVETGYKTQGLDEWRYAPTSGGVGMVQDFSLTMITDFDEIDFPSDSVSPTEKVEQGEGWQLSWTYESLVSGRPIGLTMPTPLNPGPVASRISFFAPISLLFYFAAVVLVSTTRGVKLHPMNYAFLAAAFFAFHLLFAYLVDRIDIYAAFAVASIVSLALCLGYLRLVVSDRRALVELGVSQFVFLVLFSFSFFFEGLTGLAITIGSVITLAYFMARTGHLDWEAVFAKGANERRDRMMQRVEPPLTPVE